MLFPKVWKMKLHLVWKRTAWRCALELKVWWIWKKPKLMLEKELPKKAELKRCGLVVGSISSRAALACSKSHTFQLCLRKAFFVWCRAKPPLFWRAKNNGSGVQEQAAIPLFTCNLHVLLASYKQNEKNPSTCTHYVPVVCDQALRHQGAGPEA